MATVQLRSRLNRPLGECNKGCAGLAPPALGELLSGVASQSSCFRHGSNPSQDRSHSLGNVRSPVLLNLKKANGMGEQQPLQSMRGRGHYTRVEL